jgi:C4-type Zn-finger protein
VAIKFRLKGLAETFLEEITCPCCGNSGSDDQQFVTELTKVTYAGIIIIVQCRLCAEIFVPTTQRLGILNPKKLREAVQKDSRETGDPIIPDISAVKLTVEHLNAMRKGDLH